MTAFYNFIHFLSQCSLLFSMEKPPGNTIIKYVCISLKGYGVIQLFSEGGGELKSSYTASYPHFTLSHLHVLYCYLISRFRLDSTSLSFIFGT